MRGERGFRSEALETRPCSDYEQGMKRLLTASAIALLIAAAAYSLFVAIYAALTAEGYDPSIFWTSIGVIFVIAAGALWLASRFYRRHSATFIEAPPATLAPERGAPTLGPWPKRPTRRGRESGVA